jgi:glycosyltransferase involved in cell wall biosynthesis
MKKLSVIVPTFNRKDTIRTTLARLSTQTYPISDYEVLIMDDGSNDGTKEVVESLQASLPYEVRYFYHKNRGPGATQNRGILEAQGEVVLILADDMWATPRLLEKHMEFHMRYPEPNLAVLGKVLQSTDLPKTAFLKYWVPYPFHDLRDGQELRWFYFWALNVSLKRKFLLENGLFLEFLGAAHEDVELGYRLSRKGMRLLYSDGALGYHHHLETLQSVCHRWYIRGLNWWVLADNVHDPELYVQHKVFSLKAGLTNAAWLLLLHAVRTLCFNRFTVPHLFLPLLQKAETNSFLAAIAPLFYRRVISYHYRKGIADLRKQTTAVRERNMQSLVEKEAALRKTLEENSQRLG